MKSLTRASLLRLTTATLVVLVAGQLFASSVTAPMNVSVNVIARAVLTVDSLPAAIDVTGADIARGYVDVSAPVIIRVRTNSRAGYMLQAEQQSPDFKMVELTFGDSKMSVAATESWISRPYVPGGDVIAMHMRVHLAENAQVGSYAMPILLSTRPL
jgi:hypothetical protein